MNIVEEEGEGVGLEKVDQLNKERIISLIGEQEFARQKGRITKKLRTQEDRANIANSATQDLWDSCKGRCGMDTATAEQGNAWVFSEAETPSAEQENDN